MIRVGDKVRRKNGDSFSNGSYQVTIERVEHIALDESKVWLKETGTWLHAGCVEVVKPFKTATQLTIEDLQFRVEQKKQEIQKMEKLIRDLKELD